MIYTYLLSLLISFSAFSAITVFEPQQTVKSQDLNNNFQHIKSIIISKGLNISFEVFSPGQVIDKTTLDAEYSKISDAVIGSTYSLPSEYIKSEDLNLYFSKAVTLSSTFNVAPSLSAQEFSSAINNNISGQLVASDPENAPLVFSKVSNPTNGALTLNSNGTFTYIPNLNFYGNDSFQARVSDGSKQSQVITMSLTVDGIGIIEVAGVKSYYDGSLGTSCFDYYTKNVGKYKYQGSTGSGQYRIAGNTILSCDMVSSGGPYTMRTAWNASTYPAKMLAGEIYVTANQGSTTLPSVAAGVRLVGMFKNTEPSFNYMQNRTAYTITASAPGGVPGRYNYFGPTTSGKSHALWSNLGINFDSNLIVLTNGLVGIVNTIANGCCGSGGESAYIYYYQATTDIKFWVKEN